MDDDPMSEEVVRLLFENGRLQEEVEVCQRQVRQLRLVIGRVSRTLRAIRDEKDGRSQWRTIVRGLARRALTELEEVEARTRAETVDGDGAGAGASTG